MVSPRKLARRAAALGPRTRLLVVAAVMGLLFAAAALLVPHSVSGIRALVSGWGVIAPLAFMLVWVVLTPALFPGTVLAAAGGLLFGTAVGTGITIVGSALGGAVAFLIARRLGGDSLHELSRGRVQRVKERLEDSGFSTVLALRAAPGVPATWLHYAAGLSRVRLRSFVAAIAIGCAPRAFAYTALGGSLGHLGSPVGIAAVAMLVAMTVFGGLLAWRTGRRARASAAAA